MWNELFSNRNTQHLSHWEEGKNVPFSPFREIKSCLCSRENKRFVVREADCYTLLASFYCICKVFHFSLCGLLLNHTREGGANSRKAGQAKDVTGQTFLNSGKPTDRIIMRHHWWKVADATPCKHNSCKCFWREQDWKVRNRLKLTKSSITDTIFFFSRLVFILMFCVEMMEHQHERIVTKHVSRAFWWFPLTNIFVLLPMVWPGDV